MTAWCIAASAGGWIGVLSFIIATQIAEYDVNELARAGETAAPRGRLRLAPFGVVIFLLIGLAGVGSCSAEDRICEARECSP